MNTQDKPRIRVYGCKPTTNPHGWNQLLMPTCNFVSWRQIEKALLDADWCMQWPSLAKAIQASIVVGV